MQFSGQQNAAGTYSEVVVCSSNEKHPNRDRNADNPIKQAKTSPYIRFFRGVRDSRFNYSAARSIRFQSPVLRNVRDTDSGGSSASPPNILKRMRREAKKITPRPADAKPDPEKTYGLRKQARHTSPQT